MILIHSYFPKYIKKLFDAGIAKKGDGVKINQTYKAPDDKKFNEIAKEGSVLFDFIKNNASCFYVDRLQGGTFYSKYEFSKELIAHYRQKTDAEFLGLQLHEIGSTRGLDWQRIQKCLAADNLEWNEENIYESVKKISTDKDFPHFSQASAKEYAELTPPKTISEFVKDVDQLIEKRQKETGGHVFTCDAGSILCYNEQALGLTTAFIEIGAQTPHSRIQYALRRGLSKARGAKWGVYIEPWGFSGNECTAYRMTTDGSNDWYAKIDNKKALFKVYGENGGSSMSLAKRIMFYSLFAGADYFSEEWGAANTFYDWDEGGLTPYGVHKKKMADLSRKLTNVSACAPIAIILPKEYRLIRVHGRPAAFENDITDGDYCDIIYRIHRLFYNHNPLGSEDNILTVGRYGSLFDIIYEDCYLHPQDHYQLLIDFSGNFTEKYQGVVDGYNEENLYEVLDQFVTNYLPFSICSSADVDYTLFENDGKKYACIFNHSGISKCLEDGETENPSATVSFTLTLKNATITDVFNLCDSEYLAKENLLKATLTAGTFILFCYE